MSYKQPDKQGHFEEFGGKYVPETLIPAINSLESLYLEARDDMAFGDELSFLLQHYSGRPTPLYFAQRISKELGFNVIEHSFPDHYQFTEEDLTFSYQLPVVMTEKDATRCSKITNKNIWVLKMDADLPEEFALQITKKIEKRVDD